MNRTRRTEPPASFPFEFSIVIPAYNEARRLPATLEKVRVFLSTLPGRHEIVVVDDGSRDGTSEAAKAWSQSHENGPVSLKLLTLSQNKGKGYAVRQGVLAAKGRFILFTDADNSTPIEELEAFRHKTSEADILIGSRYHNDSNIVIRQKRYRVRLGRLANRLIRACLIDNISDTQCGFKLFPYAAARDIFSRARINRWGFDMEVLVLARDLGYSVLEVPVSWYNSSDSRLRPLRDSLYTLGELCRIKFNQWTGGYRKTHPPHGEPGCD